MFGCCSHRLRAFTLEYRFRSRTPSLFRRVFGFLYHPCERDNECLYVSNVCVVDQNRGYDPQYIGLTCLPVDIVDIVIIYNSLYKCILFLCNLLCFFFIMLSALNIQFCVPIVRVCAKYKFPCYCLFCVLFQMVRCLPAANQTLHTIPICVCAKCIETKVRRVVHKKQLIIRTLARTLTVDYDASYFLVCEHRGTLKNTTLSNRKAVCQLTKTASGAAADKTLHSLH